MIGAGNMGGAMLRRWLAAGMADSTACVSSPSSGARRPTCQLVRVASHFEVG